MVQQAFIQAQKQEQSSAPIACGVLQRKCDKCRKKKLALQRSAIRSIQETLPPIVNEVLRSPGQPLDRKTREFMELRFGHDFSRMKAHTAPQAAGQTIDPANDSFEQEANRVADSVMHVTPCQRAAHPPCDFSKVRVHSDPKAAESARAVNAKAYTVGQDIVFGSGQYAPGTKEGLMLLAHELTHTAQQVNGMQRSELKTFKCSDYAGDRKLEACLNDQDRLRPGDTGPSVAKVQNGLMKDDVSVGQSGADGIFGKDTAQGVKEFKRKYKLGYYDYPDVGPGTMDKLDKLCKTGPTPGGWPGTQPEPRSAPDVLNLRTLRPGIISPILTLQPEAESSPLVLRNIVPRIAPITLASPHNSIDIRGQVSAEVKLDSEGDVTDPCRLAEISTQYNAVWRMRGYGIGKGIKVLTEVSGGIMLPSGCEHLPEFELATNLLNFELLPQSIQFSVKPLLTFGGDIQIGLSTEAEFKPWGSSNNFLGNISLTGSIGMKSQMFGDHSTILFSPVMPETGIKAVIEYNGF